MRKTLLFLLLLSVKLAFGQFRDNFSDGNFAVDPVWAGQTPLFNINGAKQLSTSLSSVSQTVSLSTPSYLALNVKWEFLVQLGFDPSATNLTRIYLIADQADLKGRLNGYFIQIGESGRTDSYDLYKQTGNSITKIIDGLPKERENINYLSTKLSVTRDDSGKWEVYTSVDEGITFNLEGTVTDKSFTNSNWFGVYCRYTATRSDGFVFDDFKVEELVADVTPPTLLSVSVIDEYTIEAVFSEALSPSSALMANNYLLKERNEYPTSVIATLLPNVVRLSFASAFQSARYNLLSKGITDLKGNILLNGEVSTFYIRPYIALKGDLVINEIFADPSPPIGLPAAEFIEVWNTSDKYLLLKDWTYKDLTTTYTFMSDTLAPNEHVILCGMADVALFKVFGKTIGLSAWPTLNNDQDRLSLIDPNNTMIDEVFYDNTWYKDAIKGQGGYSLELVDPKNRCRGIQNWQGSNDRNGGTPGRENSIYQQQIDLFSPKIRAATLLNDTTIRVDFSKSIDSLSGALIGNYKLNNGVGSPFTAIPQSPGFTSVLITLNTAILKGQAYELTINNVADCAGNLIDQTANTSQLFMAKDIVKGDILISEVLVNPKSGGVDFIEIFNAAEHVLDLAFLNLATTDGNGNISSIKKVTEVTAYIPSKAYWVLTSDFDIVKQHYEVKNPNNFARMATLPSYTNEKGTVVLLTGVGEIDRFNYHEKMHFSLLNIVKGVSLERVSFQKPASESGNFKSAAQASGFATPTYKNSQEEGAVSTKNIWLSTKVFSPDGDGVEDILQVNYQFLDQDYLANVTVFNDKGMPIKKIYRNATIPKTGYFTWDGLDDAGALSKVGIYVVKIEIFALNGKSKHFTETCVLAAKLY